MKISTRFLMVVGAGLMAGTALGAPAQAAESPRVQPAQPAVTTPHWDDDDDEDVVGYFRTLRACERVGRIGEWRDRWEDYDCNRVRWGFRRGFWELEVERDRDWGHHRPGHHDHDDDDDRRRS
jgi:hypothetical protein